jgi:hypothetical protein
MFSCSWAHILASCAAPNSSLAGIYLTTQYFYETACNNGGSSTSHASTRGDCRSLKLSQTAWPPNSKSTQLILPSQDSLDSFACPIGPHDIASGWNQQKTPFLASAMLQYDVAVAVDPQKTCYPESLHCCVMSLCQGDAFIVPLPSNMPWFLANMSQYLSKYM